MVLGNLPQFFADHAPYDVFDLWRALLTLPSMNSRSTAFMPAAVATQNGLEVHFSTSLPAGLHLIELREPRGAASAPYDGGTAGGAGRSLRVSRSDGVTGGTVCVNCARTGLWEPGVSDHPGRPGRLNFLPLEFLEHQTGEELGLCELLGAVLVRIVAEGFLAGGQRDHRHLPWRLGRDHPT